MYVAVVLVVGVDPRLLFDNLYQYGFGLRIPSIPVHAKNDYIFQSWVAQTERLPRLPIKIKTGNKTNCKCKINIYYI